MQDVLCIKRIELKHSARKGVKTIDSPVNVCQRHFLPHCDIRLYFKCLCPKYLSQSTPTLVFNGLFNMILIVHLMKRLSEFL